MTQCQQQEVEFVNPRFLGVNTTSTQAQEHSRTSKSREALFFFLFSLFVSVSRNQRARIHGSKSSIVGKDGKLARPEEPGREKHIR